MDKDMRQMTALGRKIENGSFQIIDDEVGPHGFPDGEWQVVRRVIHSTADFEYKDLMAFDERAIESGIQAFLDGAPVVVDVRMIDSGLNQNRLDQFGCGVHCFISDEDVIQDAKAHGSTRAAYSVKKAQKLGLLDGAVIAVGNAPTFLLELCKLIREEGVKPALIVGVPVGFVSAAESKEEVMQSGVPYMVSRGRKGGSPIAVAILHAIMYQAADRENT